jgi:hypothetical protein
LSEIATEFLAELHGLSSAAQLRHTAGVLSHSFALRAALANFGWACHDVSAAACSVMCTSSRPKQLLRHWPAEAATTAAATERSM